MRKIGRTEKWRVLAALCMCAALAACGPEKKEPASVSGANAGAQQESGEEAGESLGAADGEEPGGQAAAEVQIKYAPAEKLGTPCGLLSDNMDLSGYDLAGLTRCGYDHEFEQEEMAELKERLGALPCVDAKELHIYENSTGWVLNIAPDYKTMTKELEACYEGHEDEDLSYEEIVALIPQEKLQELRERMEKYLPCALEMSFTNFGYCVTGSNGLCCVLTPELQEYFAQFREMGENPSGEVLFSVEYSVEPKTETECRDAAVFAVRKWLEECGKEGTAPEYQNRGFQIAEERKNNFVAAGFVDGRREFLAEVCCTVKYDEEADFYRCHEISRYTLAGTYWEGVYLCARLAWENGMLSILSMNGDDRGLNGFQTSQYRNFYEYARRSDLEEEIRNSFVPYMGVVVSKNLTVTENGKEINLDIYQMEEIEDRGETIYGNPDFRTYRGTEMYYGTGVYFTDNGTSTKYIEYPKSFRLTFENYTNDGNPDYAVLYDTDKNGAYYVIESIQSDGRVFNHSGRAYQGGVYVAGCFDPSPRLQRTEGYSYIGWEIDESGNYFPTSGGYRIELPAVNMYSDRLYLPDSMRLYLPEENTVTCFVWNNTAKPLGTEKDFVIQYLEEDENWTTLVRGENAATCEIAPRQYAEISYDLSILPERKTGRYRIVQNAGDEVGYGEFWLQAGTQENEWEVRMTDEVLPEGCLIGSMNLVNTGVEFHRVPKIRLCREDGQEVPIRFETEQSGCLLRSGDSVFLTFFCGGQGLTAGRYDVMVGSEKRGAFEVKENFSEQKPLDVQMERSGGSVILTIQNPGTEDIELDDLNLYQKKDGKLEATYLYLEERESEIGPGKSVKVTLSNYVGQFLNEDMMQTLYEEWKKREEDVYPYDTWREYEIPENATFEEFDAAFKKRFELAEDVELFLEIRYYRGEQLMQGKIKY